MSPRVDPMYCYRLAAALALILTLSVCGGSSNARARDPKRMFVSAADVRRLLSLVFFALLAPFHGSRSDSFLILAAVAAADSMPAE